MTQFEFVSRFNILDSYHVCFTTNFKSQKPLTWKLAFLFFFRKGPLSFASLFPNCDKKNGVIAELPDRHLSKAIQGRRGVLQCRERSPPTWPGTIPALICVEFAVGSLIWFFFFFLSGLYFPLKSTFLNANSIRNLKTAVFCQS